jgi:superfamily II DNA or RNA helicase
MQVEALISLDEIRSNGKNKALLISATGTGKTFLSAFDVKKVKPKKLLFIVHRRTIAEKSLESYKQILGNSIKMGMYSGSTKDIECDYLFSTIQTISKEEELKKFTPTEFDYIVIDETHRAGAESYKRIMSYFKPKFILGMTATPERTDGYDIFNAFDHTIAYEIRLHKALEEDMLSPFHYYGITDLAINDEIIDDKSDFNKLTSSERIKHILHNIKFYGCDNGEPRGLIFCSRTEEAIKLSTLLNNKGLKTIALTGNSDEELRKNSITKLESTNLADKLDYIITVDIFNEGVDIPKVNQVIMLRPTQSAIIFVQQLGRGLRKADNKEYLTVIDFIGNYTNNFLVPIALFGDNTYNKDTIRRLLTNGSDSIPGASTISFDEISKKRIFESIDTANLNKIKDLKKDYLDLEYKIGKSPMMIDFINHGSRDPQHYIDHSKSLYKFRELIYPELNDNFNQSHYKLLELYSKEIANGKRIEELVILHELLEDIEIDLVNIKNKIWDEYNIKSSEKTLKSAINILNFKFIRNEQELIYQTIFLKNTC